jgi:hypothetical protein
VARGKYASGAYHNFIGFEVSKPVMERAFRSTYGLDLEDVFESIDLSIGTFRWTVNTTIPGMTKVAWELKEKEIATVIPGATQKTFTFAQTRAAYEQKWGTTYKRPGLRHKIAASLLRIVPRFGPFKPLAFKPPTAETERWFVDSFDKTVEYYRTLITAASQSRLSIANRNFDTGDALRPGDYPLVDKTYAELVERLAKQPGSAPPIPPELRAQIKRFYADPSAPIETKKHRKEWNKLTRALEKVQAGR